jgi:hypothetical protein
MRRKKRGTLRSGKGGKGGKVTSRKQAIAIALSEARKKGKKVPRKRGCPLRRPRVGSREHARCDLLDSGLPRCDSALGVRA